MKFGHIKSIENKVPKQGSFKHYLRNEEAAGVGIVTKQNATADVPVGGEYMNVKKLGLGKGKPKKHPKKVRGSKTNVLFNLGMAESIDEVTAKELGSESEIYVDMDGVLADFFGAWKTLVGTDWREIKDLDSALQKIRDKDDFWLNIPITKNAMNLLGLIKELKGKYNILSAPLPNDPNSEPHKREWIKKNLSAFPPSKVIITSNKAVHATQPDGTPNILIDDFGKNVEKWEAAGGVGFKHKDHKFERTVKNLKAHMNNPVEEAEMSKSSIKSIHKTADKIKDKPKAKKSIGNWAKERGMDPEGAIYAIATNMKKRKQGKKITGLGKESYSRDELPQIGKKHLKNIPHNMETIDVENLVPIQKERLKENHTDQLLKILEGRFNPIVVDCYNRIVNGHHRYDIVKMLKMESITVAKLPFTLEFLLEITRRDFLTKAGKVGAGLGAAALYSALPTPVKAMTKDSKPKIIMHTSIGREFDLSDREDPAKAILDLYAKIEKIYADRGETIPQVWVTLDGKQVWAPAGSIPNANKTLWTKDKAKKSNDREDKINKAARDAWDNGERLSTEYKMHLIRFRHRYKKSTQESVEEGNLIANPQRSVLVRKKDGYDHYKISTNMANIKNVSPEVARRNKPDIMIQFYGGEKEKKYMMKNLKRLGYDVQDADGYRDTHFDENIEGSYMLRVRENFADGKKKGKSRPGRVKKSGASCKGSVTSLRAKAKKASGERAKMYHWCANMKGGKKKTESLYTEQEFLQILNESTPQQLQEGIKDTLQKLPKNLLSKVTPIIKKIPKTAKNLTLMAVLLGTMVNAVAAGDMAKVNTPLDKLNNMTTMSTTMDTGTDVGPGHTMPDNIKVLKMPAPPPAPGADTPDGTADNGTNTQTDKNGNRTVSSGAGTYTFSPDGKLLKYETPKIKGYQQIHDLVKKTVTVDANTSVTMDKDYGNLSKADREILKKNDPNFDKSTSVIDTKATYDMSGKLISKDHTGMKSGGMSIGIDGDGSKNIKYNAGGGKVYKASTADMPAAKDTLKKMQKDFNIANSQTGASVANKKG